ncbi:MAG: hypothetical protein PF495_11855 [Spirochaetales bacterium]|nr:hypothetical protein [Spirochaetales bacterium]
MSVNKMSVTVLLPAGRLPLEIMGRVHDFAMKYGLEVYCSLAQNIRVLEVPESKVQELKDELIPLGADFKGPGKFPIPRVCISTPHCNLGLIDMVSLNTAILSRFGARKNVKAKFKIALAACPLGCSGTKTTDIAVIATKKGFDLYLGGKGGPFPKIGRRVLREATEEEILDAIGVAVDFHDLKTVTKQRMVKLLDDPEFPFVEV